MAQDQIKTFQYLEDLLLREDGSSMTVEEAVREHYGFRTVWVAALNSELRDRSRRPRLRGYPPCVFISYRWESDPHKEWVRELAAHIANLGFEVRLDQVDARVDEHLDVPRYVGTLASCHVFLAVITSSYCDVAGPRSTPDAGGPDGWVLDEHQTALRLAAEGWLTLVGIWKEGERLPAGFHPGNTIDVRDAADPFAVIADRLGYRGLVFSAAEQEELIELLETSDRLLKTGQPAAALELLSKAERYATTFEYRRELALMHTQLGHREEALRLAQDLLAEGDADPASTVLLAGILSELGEKSRALRPLVEVAKRRQAAAKTHYLLGNVLDDLGSHHAGALHLEYALQAGTEDPQILNDLGFVYRRARQLDSAERCLRRALDLQPGYELALVNLVATLAALGRADEALALCVEGRAAHPSNPDLPRLELALRGGRLQATPPAPGKAGRRFACGRCRASYRLDLRSEAVCGDCGTVYPKGTVCTACGNDGFVPLSFLEAPELAGITVGCPICRSGEMTPEGVLEPQELPEEPTALLRVVCSDEEVMTFLAAEIDRRLVPANRCVLLCCLAYVLSFADPGAARSLHLSARLLGENLGGVLDYPLDQLTTFTEEVEPKQFAPGEKIEEPSQVIRGAARVVNALGAAEYGRALDIAQRFTWPRTGHILLVGIYGRAHQLRDAETATVALAELARSIQP